MKKFLIKQACDAVFIWGDACMDYLTDASISVAQFSSCPSDSCSP